MTAKTIMRYAVAVFLLALVFVMPRLVQAISPEELRNAIEEKAKQLEAINTRIGDTQKQLDEVSGKKKTLEREIKKIDYSIDQLSLGIKSSEIRINKLNLELESLDFEIDDLEKNILFKKDAIAKLLRELWEMQNENLLITLLKNKSLATSLLVDQSIKDLNSGLRLQIGELSNLKNKLTLSFNETGGKKKQVEVENKNLKNQKLIIEDEKTGRKSLLVATKNQEQIYENKVAALEEQQQILDEEIGKLEDTLRSSFDQSLLPIRRPGVLGSPLEKLLLTQGYGATSFAQKAYRSKFHNGLDFGVRVGTPVFAAEDGEVIAVDNNDRGASQWQKFQYGKYALIRHKNSLSTLYAHLSRQVVKKGDIVKRGDIIGYSGNTGYSFGPHLHLTVYWAPSVRLQVIPPAAGLVPIGVTINPGDYL